MKDYYLIKEMAKAHGITKRTLHYYDKIDLLKPNSIAENGYRMYSYEQFLELQGILLWKMMGLDSSEIKEIIKEKSPQKMKKIIQGRKEKLRDYIEELIILEKNLDIMDKKMDEIYLIEFNKIKIKTLKEKHIELFDNSQGNIKDLKALLDIGARAFNNLSQNKIALMENGFIFSKENIQNKNYYDFDKCYFIPYRRTEATDLITIEGGNHACMWYECKITELGKGLEKICSWIGENGYVINGDVIVTEHLSPLYTLCNYYEEDNFIGEIQVPIFKKKYR